MKKYITILLPVLLFCFLICGCTKQEAELAGQIQTKDTEIIATLNEKSNAKNQVWAGTFQLVWNDLLDTLNNGKGVTLEPQMPKMAIELNKKEFTKDYISEDSYYIKHGILDQVLFDRIKSDIKEKFNETSDLLDDVGPTNTFAFYSMLKKDFKFEVQFDKLPNAPFGSNPKEVKYFGINKESDNSLRRNVRVIDYKNKNNFIIKLLTKGEDEVILYRTDEDKTLDKYWNDIISYNKETPLGDEDNLKVPYFDFFYKTNFPEIEGKTIKESGFAIDQALETIDFKMDEAGVKLKSEAIIVMKNSMVMEEEIKNYFFDDSFVLFLVEKGKKVPYFGMRVKDISTLNNR